MVKLSWSPLNNSLKTGVDKISKDRNVSNFDQKCYHAALELHRHLHHPDILSLLSTFESPSAFYEILDYCPYGSLSEWISLSKNGEPQEVSAMNEPQLRGVLHPIIKALLYMHKENILHLNVNPSNIFISSDYRVKLGGFRYSRRFGSKVSLFPRGGYVDGLLITENTPIHPQKSLFSAPELITKEGFGPAADVWSLGQLCVLLSSGSLQDDGLWNQSLPEGATYELRDLVDGLTQADAAHRTSLHRVPSHPFFNPALPTETLSDFLSSRRRRHARFTSNEGCHGGILFGPVNAPPKPSVVLISPKASPARLSIIPQNEEIASISRSLAAGPERTDVGVASHSKAQRRSVPYSANTHIPGLIKPATEERNLILSSANIMSRSPLPAQRDTGLPRLLLTVGALPPQTFRTPHGTIIIQKSGSVVLDFREGERIKGHRGGVVLVVRSEGTKIDIYPTPHLNGPCVLQEPLSSWDLCKLPLEFRKIYDFAAKYLQAVKRRTPMVTLSLSSSKFTMMSNLPLPDVEMTVPCHSSGEFLSDSEPTIRLRLSRQDSTLEISQFSSSSHNRIISRTATQSFNTSARNRVTEWSKRTIPLVGGQIDMKEIRERELKAVNCLRRCQELWEPFEKTAPDMDLCITNILSDQYLTIRSPLDVGRSAFECMTTLPSGAIFERDPPAHPSPDNVKDVIAHEEPKLPADPEQPTPPLAIPPTKLRLVGLGLPPRPRRLSTSVMKTQPKPPGHSPSATTTRKRRDILSSDNIDKHKEILRV